MEVTLSMIILKRIKSSLLENKEFVNSFVKLLIPITLQNVISYALSMADTVMVGAIGEAELSAVSLANQPFGIFWAVMFGFISGGSILISQYWGKRDVKNINRITGFILLLVTCVAVILTALCLFLPSSIMSIYTDDKLLIEIGTKYLRVISLSYITTGISTVSLGLLRCTEQATAPLVINCCSLALNTLLNYMFIFGKLGAPNLGVTGAALATVIARLFEFVAAITFIFVLDKRKIFKLRQMIRFKVVIIKEYLRYGAAALINDVVWGVGISVHAMIIGRLGSAAVAAYTATNLAERFAFIVIGGFGSAVAVLIGKELGAGNIEQSKKYSKYIMRIALGVGLTFAVLSISLTPVFIKVFDFSTDTASIARFMIIVMALVVVTKCINYTVGVGLLRSGGDTKFMAILDICGLYLISIPLGFIAAFFFKAPAYIVYLALMTDELIKVPIYLKRYLSYVWARNITKQID